MEINKIIKDAMNGDVGAQRQIDFVWYSDEAWQHYAFSFVAGGTFHFVNQRGF